MNERLNGRSQSEVKTGAISSSLVEQLSSGLNEDGVLWKQSGFLERHRGLHGEEQSLGKIGHQLVLVRWETLAIDVLEHRLSVFNHQLDNALDCY